MTKSRTGVRSPSARWRSVRSTPQTWTRTRTWPAPGSWIGRSIIRKGCEAIAPGTSTAHACIISPVTIFAPSTTRGRGGRERSLLLGATKLRLARVSPACDRNDDGHRRDDRPDRHPNLELAVAVGRTHVVLGRKSRREARCPVRTHRCADRRCGRRAPGQHDRALERAAHRVRSRLRCPDPDRDPVHPPG